MNSHYLVLAAWKKQAIHSYTSTFSPILPIALSLIVLLLALNIQSLQAAELAPLTHSLTAVTPPSAAPALKLQNMDEEEVDIASLRGKVVVVNFWATWCPPCRREMTSLEELYLATKDNDVVVLAIDIGEDLETVFSFINGIDPSPSFPILFDTDSLAMERWKVRGLPTTFIIDTEGNIAYKAVGGREFNHPEIINKVDALRKQTGGAKKKGESSKEENENK